MFSFVVMEEGYSISERVQSDLRTKLHGGMDESRANLLGCTFVASIKVQMREKDWVQFIKTDYPAYVRNPQWFVVKLISKITNPAAPLTDHMCQIIPNSISVSKRGMAMLVSMQLECYKV